MANTLSRIFLGRIELIFLVLVLIGGAGVWTYNAIVVAPAQRCEGSGNWWDPQTRTCGHVIYLPDVTHRPPGARTPVYPNLPQSAAQGATGTSQTQ
jgi:hypothetical protein